MIALGLPDPTDCDLAPGTTDGIVRGERQALFEFRGCLGEEALQPPAIGNLEPDLEFLDPIVTPAELQGRREVVHGRRIRSRMKMQLPDFPESSGRSIGASCRWWRPLPPFTVAELSHRASLGREG